eukprot:186237-Prorocentrum_minimum.AAC.1
MRVAGANHAREEGIYRTCTWGVNPNSTRYIASAVAAYLSNSYLRDPGAGGGQEGVRRGSGWGSGGEEEG